MDWINNMTAADIAVTLLGALVSVAGLAIVAWSVIDTRRLHRRELEGLMALRRERPVPVVAERRPAAAPLPARRRNATAARDTRRSAEPAETRRTYAADEITVFNSWAPTAWPARSDSPVPAPAFASGGGGDYGGGGASSSWADSCSSSTSNDTGPSSSDGGSSSCSND